MPENEIINPVQPEHPGGQNADVQESAMVAEQTASEASTATTNAPEVSEVPHVGIDEALPLKTAIRL